MTHPPDSSEPLPTLPRTLWWSLCLGAIGILFVAAVLEPDPRGYGTHAQLGLPPCGFLSLTGAPCPGCGLTTAFAHAVRGELAFAADANPFGLLLFAIVCACVPIAAIAGWHRWSLDAVLERFAVHRWALAVAGCGVAVWALRLASAF